MIMITPPITEMTAIVTRPSGSDIADDIGSVVDDIVGLPSSVLPPLVLPPLVLVLTLPPSSSVLSSSVSSVVGSSNDNNNK